MEGVPIKMRMKVGIIVQKSSKGWDSIMILLIWFVREVDIIV